MKVVHTASVCDVRNPVSRAGQRQSKPLTADEIIRVREKRARLDALIAARPGGPQGPAPKATRLDDGTRQHGSAELQAGAVVPAAAADRGAQEQQQQGQGQQVRQSNYQQQQQGQQVLQNNNQQQQPREDLHAESKAAEARYHQQALRLHMLRLSSLRKVRAVTQGIGYESKNLRQAPPSSTWSPLPISLCPISLESAAHLCKVLHGR